MYRLTQDRTALLAVAMLLAGCASLPASPDRAPVQQLVDQRSAQPLAWPAPNLTAAGQDSALASLLAPPLTLAHASEIALLGNPRLQAEFARLGFAAADVFEASRLANPSLSLSALHPQQHGAATRIDAGIGVRLGELLLMPARQRMAAGEYQRTQALIAAAVFDLLADVQAAWFEALGAQQVARMRDAIATTAAAGAALAGQFHTAGNITVLELQLQNATATQARLAAARAQAEARRTRAVLAQRLGLGVERIHWDETALLPDLPPTDPALDTLLERAQAQRLDLRAAQQEVSALQQAVKLAQDYRWLGSVELGLSSERDDDRTRLLGPSLSLQLPIFSQGQAAIARAEAQLAQAQARQRGLQIEVEAGVRLGLDRLASSRATAAEYRSALIPQREAIVAQTQARQDFNLVGAFELLLTRQQEYDAYQGYLETVRDYWLARVELQRAVGAALPGADTGNVVIPAPMPIAPPNMPVTGATP